MQFVWFIKFHDDDNVSGRERLVARGAGRHRAAAGGCSQQVLVIVIILIVMKIILIMIMSQNLHHHHVTKYVQAGRD